MTTSAIAAARFKLAYERPYLATAVWALVPVEKPGLGTLAVDKYWRLYFDPDVCTKWTVDELVAVLYHEINHLLRQHAERGEGKANPMDWNLAGDAEINDDIRAEAGFQLPGNAMYPESIGEEEGKMAEVYYDVIVKKKKNKPQGDGPGNGQCGSAAGGDSEGEDGPPTDNSPGVKPGEAQILNKQVAEDIKEASKSRGNVPGHLENWANEILQEKVDWRKTLATYLRNCIAHVAGADDYTFKKPSRRSTKDIFLPSLIRPIAEVAVVIDTSGSMSDKEVAQAVAEVGGIIKAQASKAAVSVLAVDAAVHATKKVFKKEQIVLGGRGGTDMTVGIEAAEKLKPRPDIVIVITDGETPWPATKGPSRLIVCLTRTWAQDRVPSWAKTVVIEEY